MEERFAAVHDHAENSSDRPPRAGGVTNTESNGEVDER